MNTIESTFQNRLITLSTGSPGLRGSIHVEATAAPDTTTPSIDFVSSDETLDRYSEIISAGGWKLDTYRKNPVFQNSHQYGDIIFTLGKALLTEVRQVNGRPCLYQRIEFATDANPVARIAHALYKGGYLTSVSVGFVPIRWENGTEKSAYQRKYLEQELLELSAVAIPANPNALALAIKSGAIARSDLRETAEFLRQASGETPAEPLIALARELRQILSH